MTPKEVRDLIDKRSKDGVSANLFLAIANNEPLIWIVEVGGESKEGKIHTVLMIDTDEDIQYPDTIEILQALRRNYPHWTIEWFDVIGMACDADLMGKEFPVYVSKFCDHDEEPLMF